MRVSPEQKSPAELLRLLLRKPYWVLAAVVLLALGPYFAKPFNMDDPLFVWTAQQIRQHPTNPYGFNVNWNESGDTAVPMWQVTKNPPLAGYYLALSMAVLGESEPALHLAFLLLALAAILGTYRLARHLCGQPLLAAGVTLFTPVFLVSSASVMCDTLALAFWVWAVTWWVEGLNQESVLRLFGSASMIGGAILTKYFGICLLPLLLAYTLIQKRGAARWLTFLLIPLALTLVYGGATAHLYGRNLFVDAMGFAGQARGRIGLPWLANGLTALAFAGGCLAIVVFILPLLGSRRSLAIAVAGVIAATFISSGAVLKHYHYFQGDSVLLSLQLGVWATGGVGILAMTVTDLLQRRDANSWLLALWMWGTFLFAAVVNWTINGRSILPLVPAAAILLLRQLDRKPQLLLTKARRLGLACSFVAGAAVGMAVVRSDYLFADAVHQSVEEIHHQLGNERPIWFFGHWGFQYYLQQSGALPVDKNKFAAKAGDYIAVPDHNPTTLSLKPGSAIARGQFIVAGSRWLTTMNDAAGAGFYGSFWGPLPFAFGRVPPEKTVIGVFTRESDVIGAR